MSLSADIFTIDSRELLNRLYSHVDKIPDGSIFVLDCEADGANEVVNKLYGIGLCFSEQKAFYIPWRTPAGDELWSKKEEAEIRDWLLSVAKRCKLVGHNISYDVLLLENNIGLELADYIYSDTILMKHTTDEERPFALKELAVNELGPWADKAQDALKTAVLEAGGRWVASQKDMYLAPTEILAEYCCWDVLLTLKLFHIYQERLEKEGLLDLFYKDEVMDLYREVTIPMKRRGVRIDLPFFEQLNIDIQKDIESLEDKIQLEVEDDVDEFVQSILDKEAPIKNKGNFPKVLAEIEGIPLPVTKTGTVTLSAKAIEKQKEAYPSASNFYSWLLGTAELKIVPKGKLAQTLYEYPITKSTLRKAQEQMYFSKKSNENKRYVFNLSSNDHLGHLLFKIHKFPVDPKKKTDGGKPQVNEEVLSAYAGSLSFIDNLLMLKKLNKLHGTYIQGILERHIDGRIYASLLQFGTTSGRFASRNPNLQNLPRVPEKRPEDLDLVESYTAAIRRGFISDEGCSFIDADYSALEPRCVHENTKILSNSGYKDIKDIVIGDLVYTSKGWNKVTNKWKSAKTEGLKITTNRGILTVSRDHKIWNKTKNEWTRAEDLLIGEELEYIPHEKFNIEPCTAPLYSISKLDKKVDMIPLGELTVTDKLAWALGAFLGDGLASIKRKETKRVKMNGAGVSGYIGICGLEDDNVVNYWESIFNSMGYYFSSWYDRRDYRDNTMKQIQYSGKDLLSLFVNTFQVMQVEGATAKRFRIPNYIINGDVSIRTAFLAGLIDTDGTVNSREISISTKHSDFADDILTLLNSLGIVGSITLADTTRNGKVYEGYQIRITKDGIKILQDNNILRWVRVPRKNKNIASIAVTKTLPKKPTTVRKMQVVSDIEMYDISVENVEEFIAGNIRVHNCFSHVSGDSKLQELWDKGEDMYSRISIDVFSLDNVSANPKDANYLKNVDPEYRQKAKVFCLAVPYGAEAPRIAQSMNCSTLEAKGVISQYLGAYPGLRSYMARCNHEAKTKGYVKTEFGRVRHLPKAKSIYSIYGDEVLDYNWAKRNNLLDTRRKLKNCLNNAKNFPIQGMAGHIINRAMIAIHRRFKAENIPAYICLMVHDQVIVNCQKKYLDRASKIVQDCMENTTKISVDLIAEPEIADNMAESH